MAHTSKAPHAQRARSRVSDRRRPNQLRFRSRSPIQRFERQRQVLSRGPTRKRPVKVPEKVPANYDRSFFPSLSITRLTSSIQRLSFSRALCRSSANSRCSSVMVLCSSIPTVYLSPSFSSASPPPPAPTTPASSPTKFRRRYGDASYRLLRPRQHRYAFGLDAPDVDERQERKALSFDGAHTRVEADGAVSGIASGDVTRPRGLNFRRARVPGRRMKASS